MCVNYKSCLIITASEGWQPGITWRPTVNAFLLKSVGTTYLEDNFIDEFKLWRFLGKIHNNRYVIGLLKNSLDNGINWVGPTFPKVHTSKRIYLRLPVANCESERSFKSYMLSSVQPAAHQLIS